MSERTHVTLTPRDEFNFYWEAGPPEGPLLIFWQPTIAVLRTRSVISYAHRRLSKPYTSPTRIPQSRSDFNVHIEVPLNKANRLKIFSTTRVRQQAALYLYMALAGCVTGRSPPAPTPMVLPDGSRGFALHCVEQHGDNSACATQAVKVCGGLYTVIDPAKGSETTNSVTLSTRAGEVLVVKCVPP